MATLTDGKILSVATAPKILVRVISKGADFSNTPGLPEALSSMLQVSSALHLGPIILFLSSTAKTTKQYNETT